MPTYPRILLAFRQCPPTPDATIYWEIGMKMQILVVSLGALVLSGCSSADEKPRKGKYKPEVELTSLDFPGLTPAMRQEAETQMKAGFASQAGGEQCIGGTDKGDWKQMAQGMTQSLGGQCTTVREASTDDSVDFELKCTGTAMGDVSSTVKGKAESESVIMDINFNFTKLPTGAGGKMGMKMTAKRVGDC
jgi:hypothetical protein